jgi:hypothetical protein
MLAGKKGRGNKPKHHRRSTISNNPLIPYNHLSIICQIHKRTPFIPWIHRSHTQRSRKSLLSHITKILLSCIIGLVCDSEPAFIELFGVAEMLEPGARVHGGLVDAGEAD